MFNLQERAGRFSKLALTGLAVLALAGAACTPGLGGGAAPKAGTTAASDLPSEIKVVGKDFKFEPSTISLPAGKPVTITLENKGVVEHDLVIKDLNFRVVAKAGQSASATVTAEQAGEYAIECSIPGHKDAGMTGTATFVGDGGSAKLARPIAPAPEVSRSTYTPKPMPEGLHKLPQPAIAPPINRSEPATVQVEIESKEVTAILDDGVAYNFWTFGGTVPGPMVRVRQGDTVELTFKNAPDSQVTHSIDLHSVTGPGGGAKATQVPPGESATFSFKAINPGVYVYHCATPMVAHHIASGMYGLIVVEPEEGLAPVDHEFYVMQGDFYLKGERGTTGLRDFALDKMLSEQPDFILFNGSVGALTGDQALRAKVGETVRIYFGVGGPNITSSFHVIGEIFDRVYPEGATEAMRNIQTTLVPAGGATIVEFKLEVPGRYTLVDHSLGRLEKGAAAFLEVEGPENPDVFRVIQPVSGGAHPNTAGH